MRAQCEVFATSFDHIEGGSISQSERSSKKLVGSEFTYGEIELVHFLALLKAGSSRSGGVFWDLGCGAGKALIAASMSPLGFEKVCGVELLDGLYDAATTAVKRFCDTSATKGLDVRPDRFKLVKGDMRVVDWSDADLIYTSSICFPEELIRSIIENGRQLKKGTRIISLKKWSDGDTYKVICNCKVKMTWGKTGVYVLERV